MKKTLSVLAVLMAFVLQADVHRWKSGATGAWSSDASWEEGSAPSANDVVWVPSGVTAPAKDGDLELINTLAAIDLQDESSVLSLTITGDAAELDCAVTNAGKVVKGGAGTLTLKKTGVYSYQTKEGWKITDGLVKLPTKSGGTFYVGPMEVNAPGVLQPASGSSTTTTWMKGLCGDGILTNGSTTAVNCTFNGGSAEEPYVFTGRVVGKIGMTTYGGFQHFTAAPNADNSNAHKLYIGTLGLGKIGGNYTDSQGNKTTTQGSVGTGNYTFYGAAGLLNLGTEPYETWATFTPAQTAAGDDNQYVCATIDGGDYGGLTLRAPLTFYNFTNSPLYQLAFTGDGGTNTLRGNLVEATKTYNASSAMYVIKRGAGTWRFSDTKRGNRGVVAVDNGTLQFETLAAKGTQCSLGYGDRLYEQYTGKVDAERKVPYAFRLGTASTTGMLEYVGTNNVFCTNRYAAVNGTGGVAHSGKGRLSLGGAGALSANGTLVLAGDASTNYYFDVVNGNGTLGVRKEGDGVWTLGGNLAFDGTIDVREGTLKLNANKNYTWYRFNLKEKYEKGTTVVLDCGKFNLWNASGDPQTLGMTQNDAANGQPSELAAGQYALDSTMEGINYAKFTYDNGGTSRPVSKLFDGEATGWMRVQNKNYTTSAEQKAWPTVTDAASWMRIAMHLPAGADPVTSYDVSFRWNKNSSYAKQNLYSWSVEGSTDGIRWFELSDKKQYAPLSTTDNAWASDGKAVVAGHENHKGFTIASGTTETKFPNGISKVAIGAGAKLVTDAPVTIKNLELAATGGGTIDGFAFAEGGTLNIVGEESAKKNVIHIDVAFDNATDLQNVNGWNVSFNGQMTQWKVSASATGVDITRPGMMIILK